MKILFLIPLFILASCGQQLPSQNGVKRISLDQRMIKEFREGQEFNCDSLSEEGCPSGMARILVLNEANPRESKMCSGFIMNSKLITNHHCIADQLECRNSYISIFDGKKALPFNCAHLVAAEIDDENLRKKTVDYSVISLGEEFQGESFGPESGEPEIGQKLSAWVIDHQSMKESRITELHCTYLGENKLGNCPVISGNSGSPLVANKKVMGVIWGSTVDDTITAATPIKERRALSDLALFTHFSVFLDKLL